MTSVCATDRELDGAGRVEAHSVGVGATQRSTREARIALIVLGGYVVQERVVIAQKLNTARTHRTIWHLYLIRTKVCLWTAVHRTRVGRTGRSARRLAGRGLAGGAATATEFSVAAAAAAVMHKVCGQLEHGSWTGVESRRQHCPR